MSTAAITPHAAATACDPAQENPPAKVTALERVHRRLKNTMGTLGARVNLDGTPATPRAAAAPSVPSPAGAQSLIYFGGQTVQERKAKHGPGLAAAIYSDLVLNLEKKKAGQRELAEFEKVQMKERAALKASSQAQRMREDQNCRWLFERRNEKRDNNPAKLLEMESRVQLRKLSKAYADELSAQIADNNRFNAEKASAQKKTEMTHDAAEKYQFFNQQDYHHESRRMKPPSNSDHHRFDLLNHCPKPLLAPSPRRRAQVVEDLAKLCPLNKPGDVVSNSLPLPLSNPASSRAGGEPKTHFRRRTDVVQRIEPGPNNRLHDPAQDDPHEPAYFHFGRPGAGAPILDGVTRSKVDARLLAYKNDKNIEKLRVVDLLRV